MFSVVIPLYNKEKQIENTIKSIQNQTFQEFEIVIVNDGSTDNSVEIVKTINDKRIKLINQPNGGVSSARNTAIKNASFKYIAFLDADDEWDKKYLYEQYNLIKKYPDKSVFSTSYIEIKRGKISKPIVQGVDFEEDGILNYFYAASLSDPIVWTSAVVVEKEAILKIGLFPEGITSGEDLITWAKLSIYFPIVFSKKRLAIYRVDNLNSQGTRPPDKNDYVGKELISFLSHLEDTTYLEKYISFWYKITFSMYLKLGMRKEALIEITKAVRYYPTNFKLYIFFIITFLPKKIIDKIYNMKG